MKRLDVSAKYFQVLADPIRLKLLCLIKDQERCVGDLCQILDLSQPKVSYHLKLLLDSGLIDRRTCGTWCYYYVTTELSDWITQGCGEFLAHQKCNPTLEEKAN